MNISKVSVKRPVATLMCVLIAVSFGFISIATLKMDLLPNMNIPIALVLTTYDGAGSEEIESLITDKIESSMATVSGIDEITSTSSNGSSMVILEFEDNVDIDLAAVDVREKIDLIKRTLPDDSDEPMVIKIDPNSMQSIQVTATSETLDIIKLKDIMDNEISDRIERLNGVASVSITGGRETEVQVVVKQEKLRGYGITESTLSGILASENSNTPMGSISQGNKNLAVRIKGEFKSIEDIKNIPIITPTGANIYLHDIADVTEVYKDVSSTAYTNDIPSMNIAIQKQSTANTVNVSDAVLGELEKLKEDYPNITFLVVDDPADYIRDSIANVASSLSQGAILAVIILYIFLRDFRSTIVVGLSMPISVISTFALMYLCNMSLNLMSLGGLTLGIGMLVDNSIVVLESIYKKLEEGKDRFTSAIEGAKEVVNSVIASTLTTVAVFLPISLAGGMVAQMFNDLSITIAFSLLCSLIVAITFVPMLCSILLSPESVANVHKNNNIFTKILDLIGHFISMIEVVYKKLLSGALSHRKITFIIMIVFVFLTGSTIPKMGFDLLPQSDEGIINISIELPKGTKLSETEKVTWKVLNAVRSPEEVAPILEDVTFTIGGGSMAALTGAGEDSASITINIVDKEQREITSDEVAQIMRKTVKDIAGAEIEISASSSAMGSYSSSGVNIMVKGSDTETLKKIAYDFINIVKKMPNTSEVKSSVEDASPQTTIKVNRDKASTYGISSSTVSSIVRTAIAGSVATTYKINDDEYDIRIMQDSDIINYINDVENILIPTSTGVSIPLQEIAEIVTDNVPAQITRDNQQKYVSVTASISNVELSTINDQIEQQLKDYIMPDGYTWEFGGNTDTMNETFGGLGLALVVALFLVYMIMAAEFEAFSYPFIIMFSIPIAMTCGLLGLFISNQSISMTAFLGLIMLAGVVINNAIVLVDYANLLKREQGLSPFQAMKVAGPTRLRAVLMSTLTTVLGLVPMMISTKSGSEMMTGLATVVVFGLSFSTLVTLILIPVMYVSYDESVIRRKERKQKRLERKKAKMQG